jgi:hypothetical protein
VSPPPTGTKRAALGASIVVNAAWAVVLVAACITSGYGCGTWLGETWAGIRDYDRTWWADWCGIYGGLIGVGLAGGILYARFVG